MGVPYGTSPTSGGFNPFGATTAPATNPNDANYGGSGMSRSAYYAKYGDPYQQEGAASAAGKGANAQGIAASNNPAINPTLPNSTAPGGTGAAPPTTPYGSQSGPGLMEQWFGERANGTDPAYEYATKRGLQALDTGYAAKGMYNSGASEQGDRDFQANLESQREGQLDQLAGAADSSYNTRLATMLGLGTGLAGAEAGLGGTYDTTGANAMGSANNTGLQYGAQATMIPYLANQGLMNNIFGLATAGAGKL